MGEVFEYKVDVGEFLDLIVKEELTKFSQHLVKRISEEFKRSVDIKLHTKYDVFFGKLVDSEEEENAVDG